MPQGKGTYGDQVGRPSKKDKSRGMPYAPFKMSGHTLPGPNQRSSAVKQTQEFSAEGFDASGNRSERQPGSPGPDFSGINEFLGDRLAQAKKPIDGGPRANTDTNAESLAEQSGERVKKGVDVEVTVNGKQV